MSTANPSQEPKGSKKWYQHLATFAAGFFLTNVVPHFVNGASGRPFPSPFAEPPGVGLSSPSINVMWALMNLVFGYLLLRFGKVRFGHRSSMLVFFAGIVLCSFMLSESFGQVYQR